MSAVKDRIKISDISGLIKALKALSENETGIAHAYIEAYR